MSSQDLLQQATDAAREGDNTEARRLLIQLLALDERNVKAWTLLYRVSSDLDEKVDALNNVLEIDPGNIRAKEALEKLQARMGAGPDASEVAPGINRRQVTLIVGGLVGLVVIVLLVVSLVVTSSNNNNANERGTATAGVMLATQIAAQQTHDVETATQSSIDGTATAFAINSPTPTLTATRRVQETLPVEYTATFTPGPFTTPTPLPPPAEASGIIIGAGGSDLINDGYYNIVAIDANGSGTIRILTQGADNRGRYAVATSLNQIVYTRFDRQSLEYALAGINVGANTTELMPDRWSGSVQGVVLRADQASLSADGSKMAFSANADNNREQIFVFDYNDGDGDPLSRVLTDEFNYAFPSWSPDGQSLIVVRTDPNSIPLNTDLYRVTVATGELSLITRDGGVILETNPRYSPDGREIAYAAAPAESDHNNEIYILASDGVGSPLNISNDPSDDILPVYSPDGRYIAFASNRTGVYQIYVFDKSNGALYQLTSATEATSDTYFPGAWIQN